MEKKTITLKGSNYYYHPFIWARNRKRMPNIPTRGWKIQRSSWDNIIIMSPDGEFFIDEVSLRFLEYITDITIINGRIIDECVWISSTSDGSGKYYLVPTKLPEWKFISSMDSNKTFEFGDKRGAYVYIGKKWLLKRQEDKLKLVNEHAFIKENFISDNHQYYFGNPIMSLTTISRSKISGRYHDLEKLRRFVKTNLSKILSDKKPKVKMTDEKPKWIMCYGNWKQSPTDPDVFERTRVPSENYPVFDDQN